MESGYVFKEERGAVWEECVGNQNQWRRFAARVGLDSERQDVRRNTASWQYRMDIGVSGSSGRFLGLELRVILGRGGQGLDPLRDKDLWRICGLKLSGTNQRIVPLFKPTAADPVCSVAGFDEAVR